MRKRILLLVVFLIILSLSGCYGIDKDQIYNDGYTSGYDAGYSLGYEAGQKDSFNSDDMNKADARGYSAGWSDKESGKEYGDGMVAYQDKSE